MAPEARSLPRPLRALLGTRIAQRYRIDGVVGMGGMAVVFRGEHTSLRRPVAIKVLRPELSDSHDLVARFEREARAASTLDHPNCAQVFDTGRTKNGLRFMVMPFYEGRELTAALVQPLAPSQTVALTLQLLRGIEHAHRHGIIHRDVKPDNVFVTRDHNGREMLKLVDFGIAKFLVDDAGARIVTRSGLVFGTPGYMSTEQSAALEVDVRSDIFSVGVIAYQMLTSRLPYTADELHAAVRCGFRGARPWFPEHTPPAIVHVLSQCLAHDRTSRPPNAAAAVELFEQLAHALRRDPTPWSSLLELAARGPEPSPCDVEREDLRAVDDALQLLLSKDALCSGEALAPEIYARADDGPSSDSIG